MGARVSRCELPRFAKSKNSPPTQAATATATVKSMLPIKRHVGSWAAKSVEQHAIEIENQAAKQQQIPLSADVKQRRRRQCGREQMIFVNAGIKQVINDESERRQTQISREFGGARARGCCRAQTQPAVKSDEQQFKGRVQNQATRREIIDAALGQWPDQIGFERRAKER